jgi:mannose-6-phosphate isomerase-like protein (cupin superfamily)
MIIRNILKAGHKNLQIHEDERGVIADIFYKEAIDHVAYIDTKPNSVRGNHYHKETTQHMLMTQGSLEYWYKNIDDKGAAKHIVAKVGDLVSTPPLEIHALRIGSEGNKFIVFSQGLRGGMDYESDTFRVSSIIEK